MEISTLRKRRDGTLFNHLIHDQRKMFWEKKQYDQVSAMAGLWREIRYDLDQQDPHVQTITAKPQSSCIIIDIEMVRVNVTCRGGLTPYI